MNGRVEENLREKQEFRRAMQALKEQLAELKAMGAETTRKAFGETVSVLFPCFFTRFSSFLIRSSRVFCLFCFRFHVFSTCFQGSSDLRRRIGQALCGGA